jgi:hypothetical protein
MKTYTKKTIDVVDGVYCDITGNLATSSLTLRFGYGSIQDGNVLYLDLDHEIGEEILELLKSKYGETVIEKNIKNMLD